MRFSGCSTNESFMYRNRFLSPLTSSNYYPQRKAFNVTDIEMHNKIESEIGPVVHSFRKDVTLLFEKCKEEIGNYDSLSDTVNMLKREISDIKSSMIKDKNDNEDKLTNIMLKNDQLREEQRTQFFNMVSNVSDELGVKMGYFEEIRNNNTKFDFEIKNLQLKLENQCNKIAAEVKNLEANLTQKIELSINELTNKTEKNEQNSKEFQRKQDKEIEKIRKSLQDEIARAASNKNENVVEINKITSKIDSLEKTHEVVLNGKLDAFSKNYISSDEMKKIKNEIDEKINNLLVLAKSNEDIAFLKAQQLKFISDQNDMKKTIKEQIEYNEKNESLLNTLKKTKISAMNVIQIQAKQEAFEESLNDHQKLLTRYNEKFIEKKDLQGLVDSYIKSHNIIDLTNLLDDNTRKIATIKKDVDNIINKQIPNMYIYIDTIKGKKQPIIE